MLTPRMKTVLDFIDAEIRETGVCPSMAEIAKQVGIKSKGNVHRIVSCLEERGFVRRLRNRSRAIEVLKRG